jgi:large subunit ribosomal protein L22
MSAADDMDREDEATGGGAERAPDADAAARKASAEEQAAAGESAQAGAPKRPTGKRLPGRKRAARKAAAARQGPAGEDLTSAEEPPAEKPAAAARPPAGEESPAGEEPTRTAQPAAEQPAPAAKAPARPAKRGLAGRSQRGKRAPRRRVVRAHARYVRTSARKARMVCGHLRGKSVEEARAILAFTPREVARDWSKLLESAVANAESNHELLEDDLIIREAYANEGPTIKRFRSRTSINEHTSHLTGALTTSPEPARTTKRRS